MESIKKKIVYYVATSLDGYICGEDEDISGFVAEGNGVQKYISDLNDYKTVIMGRKTYEFGYKFGLKPGGAPYPHMNHHIFSDSLHFDTQENNVHINKLELNQIDSIKAKSPTDVYLCGGGVFAGWLLDNEKIDILKLKINPFLLGKGTKLFGGSKKSVQLELLGSETFDGGLLINTYKIKY
jgi:dihydrofolate reductase